MRVNTLGLLVENSNSIPLTTLLFCFNNYDCIFLLYILRLYYIFFDLPTSLTLRQSPRYTKPGLQAEKTEHTINTKKI